MNHIKYNLIDSLLAWITRPFDLKLNVFLFIFCCCYSYVQSIQLIEFRLQWNVLSCVQHEMKHFIAIESWSMNNFSNGNNNWIWFCWLIHQQYNCRKVLKCEWENFVCNWIRWLHIYLLYFCQSSSIQWSHEHVLHVQHLQSTEIPLTRFKADKSIWNKLCNENFILDFGLLTFFAYKWEKYDRWMFHWNKTRE